jgi:hypothetical protein
VRIRNFALIGALLIALVPRPAHAQGDFLKDTVGKMVRKVGFHASTSFSDPIDQKNIVRDGSYGLSVGLAPGLTNGWRYPFGFGWFTEELKGPSGASFVKLQSLPVVGGIGYGWHFGKLSTGIQMQAGWAFNSGKGIGDMGAAFGAPGFPISVDIGDSFVVPPQAKVEYFLTPKFTVRTSLNYVMAHPMVTVTTPEGTTSKRWDASNVTLSVGIGVYPFRK